MVTWVTLGIKENCCHKIALTLFQLASAGNDLRQFIAVPWTFPKVNSLGLHSDTVCIFFSFKLQLKYNSGFPLKGGIFSENHLDDLAVTDNNL